MSIQGSLAHLKLRLAESWRIPDSMVRRGILGILADRLGYGERFLRQWSSCLAYCEAGFEERWVGNVQVVLAPRASR